MSKSYVTMEQNLCPICGKTFDTNALLLDRHLRDKFEMKTTTGYGLCSDCDEKSKQGYLALVVCDETKSHIENNASKLEDVWRTGEIIHMKREVAFNMFNVDLEKYPDFVFIDTELATKLKELKK